MSPSPNKNSCININFLRGASGNKRDAHEVETFRALQSATKSEEKENRRSKTNLHERIDAKIKEGKSRSRSKLRKSASNQRTLNND